MCEDSIEIEGILESVKKNLGILKDETVFDSDIIFWINSEFSTLHQLGIGPVDPYKITGYSETWSDFKSQANADMVRAYIFVSTKLGFDPPSNSFLVSALQEKRQELTWRLEVCGSSYPEEEREDYASSTIE